MPRYLPGKIDSNVFETSPQSVKKGWSPVAWGLSSLVQSFEGSFSIHGQFCLISCKLYMQKFLSIQEQRPQHHNCLMWVPPKAAFSCYPVTGSFSRYLVYSAPRWQRKSWMATRNGNHLKRQQPRRGMWCKLGLTIIGIPNSNVLNIVGLLVICGLEGWYLQLISPFQFHCCLK